MQTKGEGENPAAMLVSFTGNAFIHSFIYLFITEEIIHNYTHEKKNKLRLLCEEASKQDEPSTLFVVHFSLIK